MNSSHVSFIQQQREYIKGVFQQQQISGRNSKKMHFMVITCEKHNLR